MYSGYSPVGDIIVVSICFVMLVLMLFSYNRHTKTFRIFLILIGLLIGASLTDVVYNMLTMQPNHDLYIYAYILRCFYHALLFSVFLHFVIYIAEATEMTRKERMPYNWAAGGIWLAVVVADVIETVVLKEVIISSGTIQNSGIDVFFVGYAAYIALLLILLQRISNRLYRRVMMGFYGTMGISFLILFIQTLNDQNSFTVATFLYPVIAMFYIMHSNPYDARLGTLDSRAFADLVKNSFEKKREFAFLSLFLKGVAEEGMEMPAEIGALVRRYAARAFRKSMLFQIDKGQMIMAVPININPDYRDRITEVLEDFNRQYEKFGLDYKIVIGRSIEPISEKNEYAGFIRSIQQNMEMNSVHFVDEEDVRRYGRMMYIRTQLDDIFAGGDLDDPRVLCYCQPVYNIKTGKYDTAEALMRLKLEGIGLISPDQFIPMAEEQGYIHGLTKIILHKTCEQIRRFTAEGYSISRISVNISALELKYDGFCDDVNRIINSSGIQGDKLAIELTESRSESDFVIMKNKIRELKEKGIKIYLDDFGTGYSNMERIMELPFDIIKFDRSMVNECTASERARRIVASLAKMFTDMNYYVLYEGVEDSREERMCMGMAASYLQGYKYSRPIPIEHLSAYLDRRG